MIVNNVRKYLREISLINRGMGSWFALKYAAATIMTLPGVVASRSLGEVDKRFRRDLFVQSHGFKFSFPAHALPVVREIHLNDCYGFDASMRYGVVVDLGANSGTFSALAAKTAARVVSVECNTSGLKELFDLTMKMNGLTNVAFVNSYVAAARGEGRVTINELLRRFSLNKIDFLKIDIEGAESELFSADSEWLSVTDRISMEVHPCFGVDVRFLLSKLSAAGFSTELLDKQLCPVAELAADSMGYIRAVKK